MKVSTLLLFYKLEAEELAGDRNCPGRHTRQMTSGSGLSRPGSLIRLIESIDCLSTAQNNKQNRAKLGSRLNKPSGILYCRDPWGVRRFNIHCIEFV